MTHRLSTLIFFICSPPLNADHCFYVAPKRVIKDGDDVWYTKNAVGHNTLGNIVKMICDKGQIDGYYTNHSLRATTASRGLENGIPDKLFDGSYWTPQR